MNKNEWKSPTQTNIRPILNDSISRLSMVNKEKLYGLSEGLIGEFSEYVWTMTSGDADTVHLLANVLTTLFDNGQIDAMYDVLRLLYGILGLQFPAEIEQIDKQPGEKKYFLFSFLLAYSDAMDDYIEEQS